jgi:elongation factor P
VAKAGDLKTGMVVEINGTAHAVKQVEVKNPTSRGASTLYKIRFTNLKTGQKLDESFKGDDFLKDADFSKIKLQFSYKDGENFYFMNMEDYSQFNLGATDLENQTAYLTEGLEGITGLLIDDELLAIELPAVVILSIVETSPAIKGASASARTKTARLSTGLEVQIPEYMEANELIKVNTESGTYISRIR